MTDRRTRRLDAENKTISTGEAVWVEIIEDLTWGELKKLQRMEKATFDDAAVAIAKYVPAWNVEGRNADTGELEELPPPAEAGPEVFDAAEPWVITWIFYSLRGILLLDRESLGKKPVPIEGTPGGTNAAA